MLKTKFHPDEKVYSTKFFLRFSEPSSSVAAVKLFNEAKSPHKFYKITINKNKVIVLQSVLIACCNTSLTYI